MSDQITNPHQHQELLATGAQPQQAVGAMILLHGRGASADDILSLARQLRRPDWYYLAPQAAENSWWPRRFIEPFEANQPWFDSALSVVAAVLAEVARQGIPAERTMLLGFSQGAVLASEFAARNARRYAGVIGLSGGLFGPPGTPREYAGSFEQTPVLLGCSDSDAHIPLWRVQESAEVFSRLGADVDLQIYRGMGHTVNADELARTRAIMDRLNA